MDNIFIAESGVPKSLSNTSRKLTNVGLHIWKLLSYVLIIFMILSTAVNFYIMTFDFIDFI